VRTILASSIIVCAAMAAMAADLPQRKPGLWDVTLSMPNGRTSAQAMKFCTDAATDASLYQAGMNAAQGMCSRNDVTRAGNIVTIDTECKMGDMTVKSHAVMTFTSDTAYTTNIQTHFDPPMMGRSESSMTQEAKWAGACPADLQPGDMVMPNGMKMNMKSLGH
jgi:hypothetical protein